MNIKLVFLGENLTLEMENHKTIFSKKIKSLFHFETNENGKITGMETRGKGIIEYFENQ